jgi:predicted DsbA family dithiol-disulfide isomerase
MSYYTDPACPWSWALEPTLRRLEAEFGSELAFAVTLGGLAREFGAPERIALEWMEAGERGSMPVDPRLWLQSPPSSSYPACLAAVAALEQVRVHTADRPSPATVYVRRLREGFACRRRKLDAVEALLAEAQDVPGLDVARLRIDLASDAIVEAFAGHLERTRAQQASLPTLLLRDETGRELRLEGWVAPAEAVGAVRALGARGGWGRFGGRPPAPEDALRAFGPLATAELAAVCDLPGPRAAAALWQLAGDWRVRAERCFSGHLWSLA